MAKRNTKKTEASKSLPRLTGSRSEAKEALDKRVKEGEALLKQVSSIANQDQLKGLSNQLWTWHDYNVELLRRMFDTPEFSDSYNRSMGGHFVTPGSPPSLREQISDLADDFDSYLTRLQKVQSKLELIPEPEHLPPPKDPMVLLAKLFDRFHLVARQLQNRYDDRETLEVDDEYDVQDLLHSLLKLDFDDIRTEEWAPSYAGGSTRMDFLLNDEETVIEVKKTRKGLNDRQLGQQLIQDIAHYQGHPRCRRLTCFVYDPDGKIGNPTGVTNDLEQRSTPKMEVRVFIRPR